jgi:Concanavalin A-like lectin/glucanases superfamily/Trypsin-like peptidase domain
LVTFKILFFIGSALAVLEAMQNQFKNNPLELQSGIPLSKRVLVSVIGGLDSSDPPQSEAFDKILRIVRERSQTENTPLVSVASDPKGFLSTSFLETGVKYSQSVCRIARYFSCPDFIAFIGKIQSAIATPVNVSSNFDSLKKVIEVFSIPRQVANDIFNIADYEEIPNLENPLEILKGKITENQLAKINPIPIGTGFLVGGSHLLTNHHVIESKEIAAQCVAQFNYVENAQGYIQKSIDYEFDPILFVTEPGLDYTLVQLKSGMFTRQAGYEFGWVQLIEDEESVKPGLDWVEFKFQGTHNKALEANQEAIRQLRKKGYIVVVEAEAIVIWHPEEKYDQDEIKAIGVQMGYKEFSDAGKLVSKSKHIKLEAGDAVIIVQHPKGKQKQIVLSNNEIIKNGLYQGVLRYKAQSNYGSSGSPVFNTHWKLVALHHAAVPRPRPPESSSSIQQREINDKPIAQQGIRICRIIEDIRRKSVTNSKLRSFVQDFVITTEQLNYPPLPAVARLNGAVTNNQKNGYFDCGNHESLAVSEAITFEAWVAKRDDENGHIFFHGDNKNQYGVWWFRGKIRVELYLESLVEVGDIPEVRNKEGKRNLDTTKLAPQDGLWHHIAFTWKVPEKPQIYIDGKKLSIDVDGEKPELTGDRVEIPLGKIDKPVFIGSNFGGDVAEVRLWKTERSQTQIKETMYQRLTGDHSKEGLIGYWQFEKDRASKTYVYNLASPYDESKVPTIALFPDSPKIQPQFGLELNGETDYIDCGSFAIENAVTFEAWVKPNTREQHSFIAGQGGSWDLQGYSLTWNRGKITVELQGDQPGIKKTFDAEMPNDNDWHHIAFTWSSNLPNICIYIDGKGSQDNKSFTNSIGPSDINLCIGRSKAITFDYFKGLIAEVRLWKVARSKEEINAAMSRCLNGDEIKDDQLIGYWQLDEQTGNEAANLNRVGSQPGLVYGGKWLQPEFATRYNSQGNYGVPFGDVKWLKASECSASLPLPCGLKFNGKDAQVNCGNDPSLNVSNTITVEAWVKHRFGNRLIVSRGCYVDDGYSLCWHDGKIRVMLLDKIAKQKVIVDTKENAPVDQVWHHVAFTWDRTSQEVFIYVDGRQQDCVVIEGQTKSIAYAGQTKSTALFTGSLSDLTTDLVIGATTEKERYSDVAIAEVRLWKEGRTQDEIKTNMTCRLSHRDDDWKNLLGYWRLDDGGEGNTQARNLKSDSNHGVIQGARWFPAPPASASLSQPPTSTENPSIPTPSA